MIIDTLYNWWQLVSGIQFLLGTQLIIIAIFLFIYRSNRSHLPLAFLCLILGLWFFKHVFIEHWHDNLFLFILIGPGKPIYAGTLLFFYYKLYSNSLTPIYKLKHLLLPTLYYLLLITYRYFELYEFPSFSNGHIPYFSLAALLIFWYYFFKTKKVLKIEIKEKIIPKAYKKIIILFYSTYFFMLQVPIWDIYNDLINAKILAVETQKNLEYVYHNFFKYAGEYMSYSYLHILGFLLFLYALTEVRFFKRLFLPKDSYVSKSIVDNKNSIETLLSQHLKDQKLFKNSQLTLESCAFKLNIPKKDLTDYLTIVLNTSFKDYINKLRVNEFKELVKSDHFSQYDLVGLAKECGFKSKSTFYRIFKTMEGMTPNEFKNQN